MLAGYILNIVTPCMYGGTSALPPRLLKITPQMLAQNIQNPGDRQCYLFEPKKVLQVEIFILNLKSSSNIKKTVFPKNTKIGQNMSEKCILSLHVYAFNLIFNLCICFVREIW